MVKPSLTERTLPELFDAAFRVYTQNFSKLIMLALLGHLPTFLLKVAEVTVRWDNISDAKALVAVVVGLVSMVLVMFTSNLMTAAVTRMTSDSYLGREVSLKEALGHALRRFPALLWSLILSGIWIVLGYLMLIVPGVYWSFTLALVVPAVMLENISGNPALKRSKQLFLYNQWKVVGTLVCSGLIFFACYFVLGMLLGVTVALAGIDPESSPWVTLLLEPFSYLVTPLFSIVHVLLYYDMRIRGEGFDLEMLGLEVDGPEQREALSFP